MRNGRFRRKLRLRSAWYSWRFSFAKVRRRTGRPRRGQKDRRDPGGAAIRGRRGQSTGSGGQAGSAIAPQASGEAVRRGPAGAGRTMAAQSAGEAEGLARRGLRGRRSASRRASASHVPCFGPLPLTKSLISRTSQELVANAAGTLAGCANPRKAFGSPCRAPSGRAAPRIAWPRGEARSGSWASSRRELSWATRISSACISRSAMRKRGRPDCGTPIRSPAPRSAQVLLGDAEAVLGGAHDLEPGPRRLAERRVVEQEAGRPLRAAAHPAAQLVELGEAEGLGALDHHDRGVRDVDAHLDHRGGDQEPGAAGDEVGHRGVLLRRRHLAVHQAGHARAERERAGWRSAPRRRSSRPPRLSPTSGQTQ